MPHMTWSEYHHRAAGREFPGPGRLPCATLDSWRDARVSMATPNKGLWLIGAFKLAKGLLLALVGVGALHLVHKDVADVATGWLEHIHVDPDGRLADRLLTRLLSVDDRRLRAISAGTFVYAALLLTEGIGLLLRKRWAEYFTVIVTSSFIPLELYELWRRTTMTRVIVIAINVAIVWYLVAVLRRSRAAAR